MPNLEDLLAAIRAKDLALVRRIVTERPELAGERPVGGPSPVLTAVYVGAPDLVAILRDLAPLDSCEAAAVGDADRLREVLDRDPGQATRLSGDGWTPLHLAGFFGRHDAASLLLARGASVSAYAEGETRNQPLHAALAGEGDRAIAELLLEDGADPNGVATGGWRPLHLAAARGREDLVRLLVGRGARADATSDDGKTPADVARARGHADLAALLEGVRDAP